MARERHLQLWIRHHRTITSASVQLVSAPASKTAIGHHSETSPRQTVSGPLSSDNLNSNKHEQEETRRATEEVDNG